MATTVTLIATLAVLARLVLASSPLETDGPQPLALGDSVRPLEVASDSSPSLRVEFTSGPKVVYAFLTTCSVCEAQRERMRDLLAQLPPETVLTGSVEALGRTRDYWRSDESRKTTLQSPVQFSVMALQELRAYTVPYMIVVGRAGTVVYSHVGTASISVDELKALLR